MRGLLNMVGGANIVYTLKNEEIMWAKCLTRLG